MPREKVAERCARLAGLHCRLPCGHRFIKEDFLQEAHLLTSVLRTVAILKRENPVKVTSTQYHFLIRMQTHSVELLRMTPRLTQNTTCLASATTPYPGDTGDWGLPRPRAARPLEADRIDVLPAGPGLGGLWGQQQGHQGVSPPGGECDGDGGHSGVWTLKSCVSWVSSQKQLDLPVPLFPHLQNGDMKRG